MGQSQNARSRRTDSAPASQVAMQVRHFCRQSRPLLAVLAGGDYQFDGPHKIETRNNASSRAFLPAAGPDATGRANASVAVPAELRVCRGLPFGARRPLLWRRGRRACALYSLVSFALDTRGPRFPVQRRRTTPRSLGTRPDPRSAERWGPG